MTLEISFPHGFDLPCNVFPTIHEEQLVFLSLQISDTPERWFFIVPREAFHRTFLPEED